MLKEAKKKKPKPEDFGKLNASPDEIASWLEWAGKNLLALPIRNPAPAEPKIFWPDFPQDPNIVYNEHNIRLRPIPPGRDEIEYVDKILELIIKIKDLTTRRILQLRCLVAPINNRFIYSWEKLSTRLELPARKLKSLHKQGLIQIASDISIENASEIKKFYERATRL